MLHRKSVQYGRCYKQRIISKSVEDVSMADAKVFKVLNWLKYLLTRAPLDKLSLKFLVVSLFIVLFLELIITVNILVF